ncbi:MAG: hypothetical protein ACI7YS_10975 [Flavobacterium sp.]
MDWQPDDGGTEEEGEGHRACNGSELKTSGGGYASGLKSAWL